jgi:hypothetical protein
MDAHGVGGYRVPPHQRAPVPPGYARRFLARSQCGGGGWVAQLKSRYQAIIGQSDEDVKRAMMRLIHDEKRLANKEEADRVSAFQDSRDSRELRDTCAMRDTVCQRRDACLKAATHISQKGSLDKEPEFKCKQFINKCTAWCAYTSIPLRCRFAMGRHA